MNQNSLGPQAHGKQWQTLNVQCCREDSFRAFASPFPVRHLSA